MEYREETAHARIEALRRYADEQRQARLLDGPPRSGRAWRWGRSGRPTSGR